MAEVMTEIFSALVRCERAITCAATNAILRPYPALSLFAKAAHLSLVPVRF